MAWAVLPKLADIVMRVNNTVIFEGSAVPIGLTQDGFNTAVNNYNSNASLLLNFWDFVYTMYPESNNYPIFQDLRDHSDVELSGNFFGPFMTTVGAVLEIYNKDVGPSFAVLMKTVASNQTVYVNSGFRIAGREYYDTANATAIYSYAGTRKYTAYIGFLIDRDNKYAYPYVYCGGERTPLTYYDGGTVYNWIPSVRNDFNYYKQGVYFVVQSEGGGGGAEDPYAGGGYSDVGGGDPDEQNFDEESDVISEPALPIFSATGSGMVTAYVPTIGEINSIADYLIDPNIIQALAGSVLKLSDVILGINIFPFQVPAANSKEVKLNLMGAHLSTGVTSHYADNQFVTMDMGSIQIEKCWDNCLDYNPYTRISIFLPFCGYYELDTDEVMGKTVNVKYKVDVMTGSCVALVIVDGSVLYQFAGQCASQIPVSSVSFDGMISSMIDLGLSIAGAQAAVGGASAAAEEAGQAFLNAKNDYSQIAAGERVQATHENLVNVKGSAGRQLMGATASAILSSKGFYTHAGGLSSAPGFLGVRKPFIIKKIPKQSIPEGYGVMRGYPSNIYSKLGDLSGYTEVEEIQLNIPNATVAEIAECERILKAGCYL